MEEYEYFKDKFSRPRIFFFFFFCLFSAALTAYGSSLTRIQIGSITAGLYHSPVTWDLFLSATCTTGHGSTGSLTH